MKTQQIRRVLKSLNLSVFVFVFKEQQIQNISSISREMCKISAKTLKHDIKMAHHERLTHDMKNWI